MSVDAHPFLEAHNIIKDDDIRETSPLWFSGIMIDKLRENSHKSIWRDTDSHYLFMRLTQEIAELQEAFYGPSFDAINVCKEAADVANFCMMIADLACCISKAKNNNDKQAK